MKTLAQQAKIIRDARALITNPGNWTTLRYARTKQGHGTDPTFPDAVCFCMLGAIRKAGCFRGDGIARAQAPEMWEALGMNLPGGIAFVHTFNDTYGHKAVLQHMDNVAAYLERKAQALPTPP